MVFHLLGMALLMPRAVSMELRAWTKDRIQALLAENTQLREQLSDPSEPRACKSKCFGGQEVMSNE